MHKLEIKNVNKIYPNGVQAVFDFNMNIEDKEFIVLLGPSGCGKSTMLRMIAGLESITSGELYIDGKLVNDIAPADRNIAMIFQDYALYGNMSVYENMAFSMTVRKWKSDDIHDKVMDASEIVDLKKELNRYPKNLSGGQRQRVALGRSIVRDATVFLMDEPLSNLDAKLRGQTRREIALLHQKLETTIIYVTHDQIEAMTMGDRIVVMNDGHVQQIDTPYNIYHHPVNLFVASFIGTPPMNFIEGEIKDGYFIKDDMKLKMAEADYKLIGDRKIIFGIRPEDIKITREEKLQIDEACITADIELKELLGAKTLLRLVYGNERFIASVDSNRVYDNQTAHIAFDMEKAQYFDVETQLNYKGDRHV